MASNSGPNLARMCGGSQQPPARYYTTTLGARTVKRAECSVCHQSFAPHRSVPIHNRKQTTR